MGAKIFSFWGWENGIYLMRIGLKFDQKLGSVDGNSEIEYMICSMFVLGMRLGTASRHPL